MENPAEIQTAPPDELRHSRQILDVITQSLDSDKADDVIVIDLAGKTGLADFMVIASGTSSRHVSSMSDHLLRCLKNQGLKGLCAEGAERGDWALVDAGDVIAHIFRPEVRSFYNLEKMWATDSALDDRL